MIIEIFSYSTSILNPLLKLGVVLGFACATCILYFCRKKYGGLLNQISTLLLLVGIAGVLSAAFRLEGDFYENFKWGESIIGLVLVIISLVIAVFVRKKILDIAGLFGGNEEDR